jgi:hypothetical protein
MKPATATRVRIFATRLRTRWTRGRRRRLRRF